MSNTATHRERILAALRQRSMTCDEIAAATGIAKPTCATYITRLMQQGRIDAVEKCTVEVGSFNNRIKRQVNVYAIGHAP